MERKKRWCFGLTAVWSLIAVGLLAASLGTDFWVVAHPIRQVDSGVISGASNVTGGDLGTKFTGYIHFGLFHGFKELDAGLGIRPGEIYVIDEAKSGLFSFGLWVSTIIFVILALILALVAAGFGILNAFIKPIETITGPMGLYLWNSLALLFSLTSFVVYLVLFFTELSKNVLTPEDITNYQWTSDGRADLSFSFYFVVASSVLFIANIIFIMCSGTRCKLVRYRANVNDKALDGVMMY